jgi:uncharacterized protein
MTGACAPRTLTSPAGRVPARARGEPERMGGRILRNMRLPVRTLLCLLPLVCACAASPGGPAAAPLTSADPYPSGAPKAPLVWADLTPGTLARAKAERRFIVLDGSAEWCHFCHVMEAETYHDPQVAEILAKSFISVKVDVDSRPDIEERYGAWGWPATVIFSPDAEELGKYRGYIPPKEFAEILRDVVRSGPAKAEPHAIVTPLPKSTAPLAEEEIAWIERSVELDLEDYYDDEEGGWGRSQKAPVAEDNAWALLRARAGDPVMRQRALFTLEKQRAVLDPVWGGIYQYSVGHDWTKPHYEKLMPYEAGALENYAEAYALTGDPKQLEIAQSIRRYIDSFLTSKEGGFYVTQDADVNAHEPGKPYVTGHDYYTKDDAHRRAIGIPRVDTHEYAKDNGLAIAAYVSLYEATCKKGPAACDASALASAEKAAERILLTHLSPKGGVAHDATPDAHTLHLADNAAFGWGLLRLFEATHKPGYLTRAKALTGFMLKELADPESGGFFASTLDPDAVGIFATRRVPFEDNVMALRLLARLSHLDGAAVGEQRAIDPLIRAVARPELIKKEGRMIGNFLLALEETKGIRGASTR